MERRWHIIIGLRYSQDALDASSINLMMDTLEANYNITWIALIPMLLVLVLAVCKMPAVMGMGISAVASFFFAVWTQHCNVADMMNCALNGYVSMTDVPLVDTILSRGGMKSMMGTISIIFFSGIMAGALRSCGILSVFERGISRVVRSTTSLIVSTLVFCWAMVAVTGNQVMGIVIPGQTMGEVFDEYDVNRKCLSRCLEDAGTIGAPIIPWSAAFAYISGVLGIGASFIPFAFLCYIVPVFSIICAATKFGIWDSEGNPVWKKKKAASNAAE